MSLLLDTSVVIPYLGNIAYEQFLRPSLSREQVYVASVTGMELLAGSLSADQRSKADAFLGPLIRRQRVVSPHLDDWLRAGTMLARYQNRFGHIEPSKHINDVLILLVAERLQVSVVTENGSHFRIWARFRPTTRRPPLVVVDRRGNLNH